MFMVEKDGWFPKTAASTAVLLIAASGCGQYADELPSGYGGGGAANGVAGSGGVSSGATAGESSAAGGFNPAGAGAGSAGREGGEGGEGGVCREGFALCADMSECTDLRVGDSQGNEVSNCGDCGTTCRLDHASGSTCEAGLCAPTCQSGFADCNPSSGNDGCETEITTVANCGACQRACNQSGATSRACVSGLCAPTCEPHYADCNQGAPLAHDDGCETYLDSLDQCTKGCNSVSVACAPSEVCNDGSCVAPAGVAILSVPLTAAAQVQRFADLFIPLPDLEGATLTIRAYAPGATGGKLVIFASDSSSQFSPAVLETELKSISQKWTDLTVQIASSGAFSATSARQINVELRGAVGPWSKPTVVYVDSIRTSNLAVNDTFDSSAGNFVLSSFAAVSGSTIAWAASVP